MSKKGFKYIFTKEKADEYKKYSTKDKLEWLEQINHFLYYFTAKENKIFKEKLRKGEI